MAEDEKEKSAYQILQALDALRQTLYQARANRRTTTLALPRSAKDADDDVDAAGDEVARPQPRRLLSPTSPLDKKDDDEEEGEDDDEDEEEGEDDDWFGCLSSMEEMAAVQGLPASKNGLRLAVNVRKKMTRDGAVQHGAADFYEALYVHCSLHGVGATGNLRPFLLSVDIDTPELDFSRSPVDLRQFAMEFTDKCQQWDMVFPLAGKPKGGELVVKLAFQSIDDVGAGTDGQPAGEHKKSALSWFPRQLRMSSISNMLASKMTHTRTPTLGMTAPDLQDIDSFMLVEPEDAQDDESELPEFDVIVDKGVVGQQEKAELKEEADEASKESEEEVASVVLSDEVAKEVANELETKALEEATPSDVLDAVADAVEPVGVEAEGSEEVSVVFGDEVANVLETKDLEEATPSDVSDTIVDMVVHVDAEAAGSEEVSVLAGDEVVKEGANELKAKALEEETPNDVSDAIADAVDSVEDVNGEPLQVPKQGEDKGTAPKPSRPRRFGLRILALLVAPVAVLLTRNRDQIINSCSISCRTRTNYLGLPQIMVYVEQNV